MGIIKKKSFFTSIEAGSKNLTFAILDAFAKDTDPNKVNLCIGGEWDFPMFLKKRKTNWIRLGFFSILHWRQSAIYFTCCEENWSQNDCMSTEQSRIHSVVWRATFYKGLCGIFTWKRFASNLRRSSPWNSNDFRIGCIVHGSSIPMPSLKFQKNLPVESIMG